MMMYYLWHDNSVTALFCDEEVYTVYTEGVSTT